MLPNRTPLPVIRPLAAVHFRQALTAATTGDMPTALAALLAIDNESWQGITARLDTLGGPVADLVTTVLSHCA